MEGASCRSRSFRRPHQPIPIPCSSNNFCTGLWCSSPDQEIVYRDLRRRTFREFRERIGRLASGLTQIGVDQGDIVAILEWDSDRYHECYFAIPMMGAVLQTVNVSLIPDDVAYTINDTG